MDAISLGLGVAAAKFIVKIWTKDSYFDGPVDSALDVLGKRVETARDRRAVQRQLDELADHIADHIDPFLSNEIGSIDEGELAAAANAVQKSLQKAQGTRIETLLQHDLSSATLTVYVRAQDPDMLARSGLGDAGLAVYDTLLYECASYITSIALKLPGFQTAQARELLTRTSNLAEISQQILAGLPTSSVPNEWGFGSEDARFENKYRRAVSEANGDLQLFGVTSTQAKSAYPLSVAYISLSVEDSGSISSAHESSQGKHRDEDSADLGVVRVESILSDSTKLLLTGGAGSGKTTLIQWIAINSIADTPSAAMPEHWRRRVPFVIPLRQFVGSQLPQPEEFVALLAPNLVGAMPGGWVHRVLASGRATLLIDGLDEMPVDRRESVRQWTLDFVRDFENVNVLVTSRSTAVTDSWRGLETFRNAELLPMEPTDMRAFILHWHSASRSISEVADYARIDAAERSLQAIVRDRPAIRSLCNSPLLCALICALHLESGSTLPNNRMDVYRTALEMLVVRRDTDRSIQTLTESNLGFREREALLRGFALWMHENGASDATKESYLANIGRGLERLYRVKTDTITVAEFLLERSGVLREPVLGRVDFVHRTFLEYLAAAAIVDDDSIEKLVSLAHEDHWREVVILAAGHCNAPQRERLIGKLLERGSAENALKHRLYLLAVACMETSPDLPSNLRDRLGSALSEVMPPTNMTEAGAVASAGGLAIPRLISEQGRAATVAAACVRALSLIGGEDALLALSTYQDDTRVTVTRQLIRAWSSFEVGVYAETVLASSSLDSGFITVTDLEQLEYLDRLVHLRGTFVDLPRRVETVDDLQSGHPSAYGVDFSGIRGLRTPADLPYTDDLSSITLRNSSISTLVGTRRFVNLGYLNVSGSHDLTDIEELTYLSKLKYLDLSNTGVSVLQLGQFDDALDRLVMDAAFALKAIEEPLNAMSVSISYAHNLSHIPALEESHKLRNLSLHGLSGLVSPLVLPRTTEVLSVSSVDRELEIRGGDEIRSVHIFAPVSEATWSWLGSLRKASLIQLGYVSLLEGKNALNYLAELLGATTASRISLSSPMTPALAEDQFDGWLVETRRSGYVSIERR